MHSRIRRLSRLPIVLLGLALLASPGLAQQPREVTIADTAVSPENLTSIGDGTLYFGSTIRGTIYRALPGAGEALAWIDGPAHSLTNVLGVLADSRGNTLWVCANTSGGRGGTPVTGQTALRAFDLATGAPKGSYPFPDRGFCNDMAVAGDGTVYVTETAGGRLLRLRPGASALDIWLVEPERLAAVDGIALLADGAIYVNTYYSGRLFRIRVTPDGAPGAVQQLATSQPLERPDGLRTVGPRTMLQAEGGGRLTEITISGDGAEVRVVRDSLPRAAGVTVVGGTAWVLADRLKAVAVPYPGGR